MMDEQQLRKRSRENRTLEGLFLSLMVAFLLHLSVVLLLPRQFTPPAHGSKPRKLTMVTMSQREWDRNRKIKPPEARKKERQPIKPKPRPEEKALTPKEKQELKDKQIVDVAPTEDNRPPEETKYLSEFNTRVKKESKSRHQRLDYKNAAPKPTRTDRTPNQPVRQERPKKLVAMTAPEQPSEKAKPAEKQQQKPDKAKIELPKQDEVQKLALKIDPSLGILKKRNDKRGLKGNSDKLNIKPGKVDEETFKKSEPTEQGDPSPKLAHLMPSAEALDRIAGAPAPDHLPEVDEGEETLLNSKQFRFASFFNRVKKSVSQHWKPREVFSIHDPYNNIYGFKDRLTVLKVTLDPGGDMKDVVVERSSGIWFLDDEAVRSFWSAQPFPNPPSGLVENGVIEFRFAFYVEVSSSAGFRLFRYR